MQKKKSSRDSISISDLRSEPPQRGSIRSSSKTKNERAPIPQREKSTKKKTDQSMEKSQIFRKPTVAEPFRQTGTIQVQYGRPVSVNEKPRQKPKKKKRAKKNTEKNVDLEEELERKQEEQRRCEELEKYRRQQFDKMTEEERQRLGLEREVVLSKLRDWEKELGLLKAQEQAIQEWKDYLNCSTKADPRSEKDLSVLLFQLENQQANGIDLKNLVQKIEIAYDCYFDVIAEQIYDNIQGISKLNELFDNYSTIIRENVQRKLNQMTQAYVKNYEYFLEENNKILTEKHFIQPFSLGNLKQILVSLAQKPDDKMKYEITRSWSYSSLTKLGVFFNPISKAGYRMKPVNFKDVQDLNIEIPRIYMASSLIYAVNWFAHDIFKEQYDQYQTISGVFLPMCLELVTQKKRSNRWALKPVYDDPNQFMKQLNYPPKNVQVIDKQNYPPMKVSFTIDKQYYIKDLNDIFAVCRGPNGIWTQEGIEDLRIESEKRLVSFMIPGLYPFMAAQVSFTDMPYKEWKVIQVDEEEAVIFLKTQRDLSFEFKIYRKNIQMLQPQFLIEQYPQLKPEMLMQTLCVELRKIGINILPEEEDAICGRFKFKLSELENQTLLSIISGIEVFSFKSSKFNSITSSDQIVIQFIENKSNNYNIQEDDLFKWKSLNFGFDKCSLIKSSKAHQQQFFFQILEESNQDYDGEWLPGTLSHSNLQILLQSHQVVPEEFAFHVELFSNIEFKENVRNFLKLIKLVSVV